jgi:hypothetical protein
MPARKRSGSGGSADQGSDAACSGCRSAGRIVCKLFSGNPAEIYRRALCFGQLPARIHHRHIAKRFLSALPAVSRTHRLGGVYELQPPTPYGIGNIIQFRAQAAGLSFERDPETNRSLDEAVLEAAVANPEPLPLLEHLLSRLYERQLARKDGLLLWADYRALGGFHNALAQHAEFVFLNLKSDEQETLQFVIRELLVPSRGEDAFLNRRSIPYRDLVLHPQLNQRQRSGAKGLVDRLIKEGLLSAKIDPQQELLISISQEALLRRWPRLWESLSQDRRFLRMRERLDASMKPRITHDGQREDLLESGIDLAQAPTLLTDFGSHLNETQIDYVKKSLARHKPVAKCR